MGKLDELFDQAEGKTTLDALFDQAEAAPDVPEFMRPNPAGLDSALAMARRGEYPRPVKPPDIPAPAEPENPSLARMILPSTMAPKAQHQTPHYAPDSSGRIDGYIPTTESSPFAAVGDIAGLPTRAAGAALDPILPGNQRGDNADGSRKSFAQGMANPDAGIMRPAREGIAESIKTAWEYAKDEDKPYLMRSLAGLMGEAAALAYLGVSAAEDPTVLIPGAATPKAVAMGERLAPGLRRAGNAVAEAPNKFAGRLAEEMSGVSEEALRAAGTKEGRAGMEAAYGKQKEIGDRLLNHIENMDEAIPEKQKVAEALANMGDLSLESAIQSLEAAKAQAVAGRLLPNEITANAKIDTYINALRGGEVPEDLGRSMVQAKRGAEEASIDAAATGAQADREAKAAALAARKLQGATARESETVQNAIDLKGAESAASGKALTAKETEAEAARKALAAQGDYTSSPNGSVFENPDLVASSDAAKTAAQNSGSAADRAKTIASASREAVKEAKKAAATARTATIDARAKLAVGDITKAEADAAERTYQKAVRTADIAETAHRIHGGDKINAVAKDLSARGFSRKDIGDILRKAKTKVENLAEPLDLNVAATDYRQLRKKLDVNIDFNTEEGKIVNDALKQGRGTMKDALIAKAEASGNPEYATWMKSWSNKLDKLDAIKKMLGGNPETRANRVERFVSTLFGKNTEHKQQLIRDLDDIFGSQILGEAKSAALAGELGKGGKAAILPRQFTGRSVLGLTLAPGVSVPFASPWIASRITLPLASRLEKVLKFTGGTLTGKSQNALRAMIKTRNAVAQGRLMSLIEQEVPANAVPFKRVASNEPDQTQTDRRYAGR